MPVTTIDDLIARYTRKIQKAERDIELAQVKIQALEEAKALIKGQDDAPATTVLQTNAGRRGRPMSTAWRDGLKFMARRPDRTASIDQLSHYMEQAGHEMRRNSLRAQLSIYTNSRGWLERAGDGLYRITNSGLAEIGFEPEDGKTVYTDKTVEKTSESESKESAPEEPDWLM